MKNNEQQMEKLAMASLVPGLTVAVEQILEELNNARAALGLRRVHLIDVEQPPAKVEPVVVAEEKADAPSKSTPEEEVTGKSEIHVLPTKKGPIKSRRGQSKRMQERREIVREAGLDTQYAPSNATVAKALRILERRRAAGARWRARA